MEGNLVGGEKANDREFQERVWKRKNQHERRRALLAQLLARTEDEDGALLRVYDDIQEEVRVKNEVLKKYKQKVSEGSTNKQMLQKFMLTCAILYKVTFVRPRNSRSAERVRDGTLRLFGDHTAPGPAIEASSADPG